MCDGEGRSRIREIIVMWRTKFALPWHRKQDRGRGQKDKASSLYFIEQELHQCIRVKRQRIVTRHQLAHWLTSPIMQFQRPPVLTPILSRFKPSFQNSDLRHEGWLDSRIVLAYTTRLPLHSYIWQHGVCSIRWSSIAIASLASLGPIYPLTDVLLAAQRLL